MRAEGCKLCVCSTCIHAFMEDFEIGCDAAGPSISSTLMIRSFHPTTKLSAPTPKERVAQREHSRALMIGVTSSPPDQSPPTPNHKRQHTRKHSTVAAADKRLCCQTLSFFQCEKKRKSLLKSKTSLFTRSLHHTAFSPPTRVREVGESGVLAASG